MKNHVSVDKVPVQLHGGELGRPKTRASLDGNVSFTYLQGNDCVLNVLYSDRNLPRLCSFTLSVHHMLEIKASLASTLLQCLGGILNGAKYLPTRNNYSMQRSTSQDY